MKGKQPYLRLVLFTFSKKKKKLYLWKDYYQTPI